MPIVVDGNNLLHLLPRPERSRAAVRRQVLDATRHETLSVTVVFDGPPPEGAPDRESLGRVTVVYAGSRSADDVIVALLPEGAAARQWSVVTDDRGLAERVRARGAAVRRLADWQRRRRPQQPQRPQVESKLSSREIEEWESYFADVPDADD
ncbi:MAG TPA: NYN domain-containing protein [Methylomirabilota bacterium]|nr:NYN domain-containing protein [Methylomirabilota bacterium]